jgi:hypothetical protein
MLHRKALGLVVAYGMYLEVAEGKIMPVWKLEEPLDFSQFWEQLSKQMLAYKPSNQSYPGDSRMRALTQQSSQQWEVLTKRGPSRPCRGDEQEPTESQNDQVTKRDLQQVALWRPNTTKETHHMCCNRTEASKNMCHLWQTSLLGLHFMQQQGDALFSTERQKCRKVLLHRLSQRFLFWFGI